MHNYHSFKILRIFRLHGLWGIYLNTAFRDLALNLVGVFLPIYVYKLTGSLPSTFLFFCLYHLSVLPSSWLAAKVAKIVGLDWLEFISVILRFIFFILLMLTKVWPGFLWLAPIVWGLTLPSCWLPYHYTVVEKTDKDHFGQTVGTLDIITKIMVGLGPFLGGLIIVSFGFEILYFLAIVIFLISGVVVFLDDFDRKKMRLDFGKMMARFTRPSLRKFWLGLVGNGVESEVYGVAWYLYIFLAISSYTVLGGIQSVSFLVSILLLYLVGRWVDRKGPQIMNWGIVGNVLNWIARPFLLTAFSIFLADLFYRLLAILIWTPFVAVTYKRAASMHKLEFFVQREWVLHLSGFFASGLMAILTLWLRLSWTAIFSLAIVGLLMCTLIITPGVKESKK